MKPLLPAPITSNSPHSSSIAVIAGVVVFYWTCSLSTIYLNKAVLSIPAFEFPYPLLLTFFQLLPSWLCLFVLDLMGLLRTGRSLSLKQARKLAPLSLLYAALLVTNNYALLSLDLYLYQVLRSVSLIISTIFLLKPTSLGVFFSLVLVAISVVLCTLTDQAFDKWGCINGLTSAFLVSLYGARVKRSLGLVENQQWRLLYYNLTLAILLLLPAVLFYPAVIGQVEWLANWKTWLLILGGSVTGFCINLAMFWQIKYTSAKINAISGNLKVALLFLLTPFYFPVSISFLNIFGLGINWLGCLVFSLLRFKDGIVRK